MTQTTKNLPNLRLLVLDVDGTLTDGSICMGPVGALGGNPFSAYGLCHLGDYEATVFSAYSHNRRFGEAFVRGSPIMSLRRAMRLHALL